MEAQHPCSARCNQPATHLCYCQRDTFYFCKNHFHEHLDTDGAHVPVKISVVSMGQGIVCNICQAQAATQLCCCRFPVPLLCVEHVNPHIISEVGALHEFFPIGLKDRFTEESTSTVRMKLSALQSAREQFEKNFGVIRQCEKAVESKFQALSQQLAEVRDKHIRELGALRETLRRSFEDAVQQFKAHIVDTEYKPRKGIDDLVYTFTPREDPGILELFRFEERDIDPRLDVLYGLEWESRFHPDSQKVEPIWNRIGAPRLAVLHNKDVCIYDCGKASWKKQVLDKEIVYSPHSSQVLLPDGYLISTGANIDGAKAEAYCINIHTGAVTALNPMLTPRYYHCLYHFKGAVFVFGGYGAGPLNQCEKLSLAENSWTQIENMHSARFCFSITEWKGLVYIVGGYSTQSELFDPVLEEFRPLALTIPDNASAIVEHYGNDLLVVTNDKLYTIDPQALQIKGTVDHNSINLYPASRSVIFRNELLYISPLNLDGVVRLNMNAIEIKADIKIVIR